MLGPPSSAASPLGAAELGKELSSTSALAYELDASPLGAAELGRELSSTSAVACELDAWVVIGRDLMSLTLFIRAFDVVEYSGKAKVHSSSSLRAQP